jgi:predicted thioredoxin/glutaredoxin
VCGCGHNHSFDRVDIDPKILKDERMCKSCLKIWKAKNEKSMITQVKAEIPKEISKEEPKKHVQDIDVNLEDGKFVLNMTVQFGLNEWHKLYDTVQDVLDLDGATDLDRIKLIEQLKG